MTEKQENIPVDEIKRLSAEAIDDNKTLLRALAEYDMRIAGLPSNIRIPIIIFKSNRLSSNMMPGIGQGYNIANSQAQKSINTWISISSQSVTELTRQTTSNLITKTSQ